MDINSTLQKFDYPKMLLKEYNSWVVLLRPVQLTLGCTVIAAKSFATSFGAINSEEMGELSGVIRDFEVVMRRDFCAEKFNYLGLMMVDPNPHFHAIPRYKEPSEYAGQIFYDSLFPKPPQLDISNHCSDELLKTLCLDLRQRLGG